MGSLSDEFESTVKACAEVGPMDAALVEAGRKVAAQIDAVEGMTGPEVTKALYLMPHLVNILKEMLATPAARKAAGLDAKGNAGGKLSLLREGQRRGAS